MRMLRSGVECAQVTLTQYELYIIPCNSWWLLKVINAALGRILHLTRDW